MPLSPFLSAESRSDREFQWQRASQGSETTGPGQCKCPRAGTSGQLELGRGEEEAKGGAGRVQIPLGYSGEERGRRMTRLQVALDSVCKDIPCAGPSAPPVWHGPIYYSTFFLLFHLHPSTPPISIWFLWALWSHRGWQDI